MSTTLVRDLQEERQERIDLEDVGLYPLFSVDPADLGEAFGLEAYYLAEQVESDRVAEQQAARRAGECATLDPIKYIENEED